MPSIPLPQEWAHTLAPLQAMRQHPGIVACWSEEAGVCAYDMRDSLQQLADPKGWIECGVPAGTSVSPKKEMQRPPHQPTPIPGEATRGNQTDPLEKQGKCRGNEVLIHTSQFMALLTDF